MRGKKVKALRRVKVDEAGAVIREHERAGTCPSCGAAVETFASLIRPDEEDIQFGCPRCSPLAQTAITGAKRARDRRHRRN